MNIVGLSISQWLPCPLAIWAFGLDGKFVKSDCDNDDNKEKSAAYTTDLICVLRVRPNVDFIQRYDV